MVHMFNLGRSSKSGKFSDLIDAVSAIDGVREAKMHPSSPNRLVVDAVGVPDLVDRLTLAAAALMIMVVPA